MHQYLIPNDEGVKAIKSFVRKYISPTELMPLLSLEINVTFTDPNKVYKDLLPEKYLPQYHWINVGVNHIEGHKLNPLHSILSTFDEDDFIVVKLDIDAAWIEVPLANQLLEGGKDGSLYHRLIDQFYFEHVHLGELAGAWGQSMKGSIKDSLDLFYGLREKGIPAHFWP